MQFLCSSAIASVLMTLLIVLLSRLSFAEHGSSVPRDVGNSNAVNPTATASGLGAVPCYGETVELLLLGCKKLGAVLNWFAPGLASAAQCTQVRVF